jgi:hypothetical protein
MKNLAFIICLISTFWSQPAFSDSFKDFGHQMSHFYLAPSKESFSEFQRNAEQFRGKLEGTSSHPDIQVMVMIAKISQMHCWPIEDGVFGERAKDIVEGKSSFARYILDDLQVDPLKIDVWWASFFATGDEQYLENIFQYAGKELPRDDISKMLVKGVATWSFQVNCIKHKKVLAFARQKLRSSFLSETQCEFVRECIDEAQQRQLAPAYVPKWGR